MRAHWGGLNFLGAIDILSSGEGKCINVNLLSNKGTLLSLFLTLSLHKPFTSDVNTLMFHLPCFAFQTGEPGL